MATPDEGNLHSLDEVWDEFEASADNDNDDDEDERLELTTQVTLTLPDGRSATGTLVLAHFDTTPIGEVGVELQLDGLEDDDFDLVDITAGWEGGWTKEKLIKAFNIAPDSRIWEVGEA